MAEMWREGCESSTIVLRLPGWIKFRGKNWSEGPCRVPRWYSDSPSFIIVTCWAISFRFLPDDVGLPFSLEGFTRS